MFSFISCLPQLLNIIDFIIESSDEEFYCVIRQIDKANIIMEYNEWSKVND